jgi:RHS repeat-associated protein
MKKHLKWISGVSVFVFALSAGAQWIEQTEPLPNPPEMALIATNTAELGELLSADELQDLCLVAETDPQIGLMGLPEANPDASVVATLAEQLESYDKMFIYVCDKIRTEPYLGLIRSPEQTLLDGAGSPMEQAHLFSELCRAKYGSGATKFDAQTLLIPLQPGSGFDICDWTGVTNSTDAVNLLLNGNLLLGITNTMAKVFWVRVGLQTTGGWYYFDPSLKTHSSAGEFDFYSAMNYSRSNLLSSAGGTTNSAGWATGLNEGAITNLMNQYAGNLLSAARTDSELFSDPGRIVSALKWAVGPVSTVPPYSNIADIVPSANGKIVLSGGGLSPLTLNTRETAHKKISIRFTADSTYKVQIYLGDGGSPLLTEGGSGGGYNTAFNLTVAVIHNGVTNSQPYSLKRGAGQYVLCQSFGGGCASSMSGYISKNITALKQRGFADDSPEVFTESLRYTGQCWMDQDASANRYLQAVDSEKTVVKYKIGIMAGEAEGFYIDAKNGYTFSSGGGSGFTGSYVASALEHAVLEQLQPGNAKGISTIRILKQANATNMPVYRATSNNWNAIKNSISGYSNEAQIEADINTANGFFILPQSGLIAMGTNWSGNGYVMSKTVSGGTAYGMMIGGDYNGGYNAWKNPYSSGIQQNAVKTVYSAPVTAKWTPLSNDPVDMQTGAFLFDHDDLTLAGPLPLNLHRSYRSDTAENNGLGTGWTHSLNIRAAEHSAIDQSLGERSAEDMIPLLTGMSVIADLLDNETGAKDWIAAALVADWTVEQLTQNAVSVYLGSKVLTFVRQPDGSFTAPPGMTVSLSKTNGVYVMQERNASTYTFKTNNLIDTISDPDGNTLTFSYNAQTNLQNVVSIFGPQLTFNYTGGTQLVSVADNSSPARTVQYQYDAKNNLTNFTDAAGKNWGAVYSNTNHPHAITLLRDPENITTIQNFYNDFGQVTNQVSATGQPYDLFITDWRSVEQNPLGQRTTYFYDDKGRTVQTQRADGNRQYTQYDGWDRVTNTINEAGVTNIFVYDTNHNLLSKTAALGTEEENTAAYGYDASNRLICVSNQISGFEFQVSRFEYDTEHHVTKSTDALGNETLFEYWPDGRLKKKTEDGGRITEYTYDTYGNPDTITSTDAGTVNLDCNAIGEMVSRKDAKNAETVFTYDSRGLLLKTVYPDGSSVSNSYWNNGLLKTATDAKGLTVSNVWNNAYKPLMVRYPNGGTISNTYDAADRLIATTDQLNNPTTYQLDSIGRITSVSSVYSVVENSYDPVGNVTNSVVDPAGLNLWNTTEYDALNRPVSVQSALSAVYSQYDLLGRQTNRIDQASKHWGFEYDALGRKTENLRPSGASEQFVYDALGNRIGFYNAEGKPITFGFDAQGRVMAITNALGKVTSYQRDVIGNVTSRTDALDNPTTYQYDALNRLIRVDSSNSWAGFSYDGNGNIVTQASPLASSSFSYDPMNRLTNSSISVNSCQFAIQNSYDLNGNRTNITYPGGLTVGYTYDAENRLESVIANCANFTNEFSFNYDSASRMTNIVYPNGVSGTFSYDAESRVTGYGYSGSSNFISRTITRDLRGFKTGETITHGLEPSFPEGEQRFENDAADRLTKITQRDTWLGGELNQWYERNYSYDHNGCLTQEAVTRPEWNTNALISEYTVDYTFDYDNRLTSAVRSSLFDIRYLYDANGIRIGRVHNSVTNYFVVDYVDPLKRPLCETDSSGNVTRYYIWAGFRLLAHLEADGTVRYYHQDELGSTLAITDESGSVTDEFAYTPYGKCTTRTGTTEAPFQWLGGYGVYYDADTDLHLTLHRAYSTDMRRWLSADPMGIDGGVNLYAYASLNPLAFVDPLGLWQVTIGGAYGYGGRVTFGKNNGQWNVGGAVGYGLGAMIDYSPGNSSPSFASQGRASNIGIEVSGGAKFLNVVDVSGGLRVQVEADAASNVEGRGGLIGSLTLPGTTINANGSAGVVVQGNISQRTSSAFLEASREPASVGFGGMVFGGITGGFSWQSKSSPGSLSTATSTTTTRGPLK